MYSFTCMGHSVVSAHVNWNHCCDGSDYLTQLIKLSLVCQDLK